MGDFRNEVKTESLNSGYGPMDVDRISREGTSNIKGKSNGEEAKSDRQATDKTFKTCGRKEGRKEGTLCV